MCFLTSSDLYCCQGSWTGEHKPLGAFLLQLEKNIVGDHISQLDKLKLVRHIHRDLVRFLWERDSNNSPKNTSIKGSLIHKYIVFIKEHPLHQTLPSRIKKTHGRVPVLSHTERGDIATKLLQ